MTQPKLKVIQGGRAPRSARPSAQTATIVVLRLRSLVGTSPWLTRATGMTFAEAASVAIDAAGHGTPYRLVVRGRKRHDFDLEPLAVTEAMRRTNAEVKRRNEDGAYGVAFLLAKQISGLYVISRSVHGTGIDWWMSDDPDLPHTHRMEVSGTSQTRSGVLAQRAGIKRAQARQSAGTKIPAVVVVVDFASLKAKYSVRQ